MDDLDGARHDAIRYLSAAVAEDRLPIEQLETRLPLIRQAPNRSSIEAIIADRERRLQEMHARALAVHSRVA